MPLKCRRAALFEPADEITEIIHRFLKLLLPLHLLRWPVRRFDGQFVEYRAGGVGQDIDSIPQEDGLFDRVGDKEYGGLRGAPELEQKILHRHARHRVERAKRLVHQNDPRMQDQGARDRDPLTHAAGELVGVLVLVLIDIQTDPSDPAAGMLISLAARYALALQSKRDIVEHSAVVKTGVVLKDHAAIGTWSGDRLAHHQHLPGRGGMLGPQSGDQSQNRTLAAAAGAEKADELALVDQILNDKIDGVNCREFVGSPLIVRLRDSVKLDDVRFAHFVRLPGSDDDTTDADLLARWCVHGRGGLLFGGAHGAGGSAGLAAERPVLGPKSVLQTISRRSSQVWSTILIRRFNMPMPP